MGFFSAKNDDENLTKYKVNTLLMILFENVYPKDEKIIQNFGLLNEQPTSLPSLTTINPEYIENIKIERKFNFKNKEYDSKIIVKRKQNLLYFYQYQ